jgi:hypothetical protein
VAPLLEKHNVFAQPVPVELVSEQLVDALHSITDSADECVSSRVPEFPALEHAYGEPKHPRKQLDWWNTQANQLAARQFFLEDGPEFPDDGPRYVSAEELAASSCGREESGPGGRQRKQPVHKGSRLSMQENRAPMGT